MGLKNTPLKEIAEIVKQAKSVSIFTHMRPDGDALGSALALSCALDGLGIENEVCDESDIPSNLFFMPGLKKVVKTPTLDADLCIAVDCADVDRLGALADFFRVANKKKRTVNIDHHISNTAFAQFNFVRDCSANCMNMSTLIEELGAPVSKETANFLMLGMLTDSGNFSHDDVTEETFMIAGKLVKQGADVQFLNYNLFKKQPKARAKLYADVIGKMRYALDDKFVFLTISLEDMQKYGADNGMTEGFVDFPLTVDTAEVSASVMEVRKGQYKISLRSKSYADVNRIAGQFGGGGHIRASGCMLFGELEEVVDRLTYAVSQYL